MIEHVLRPLTEEERELLRRLLELRAADQNQLIEQSRVAVARTLDEYGSFALEVPGVSKQAGVTQAPYAEAQTQDRDGVPVWITLFIRGGVLDEVEIVRADGSPLLRPVSVDNLDVFHPARSE
jgi:hypothetical protein